VSGITRIDGEAAGVGGTWSSAGLVPVTHLVLTCKVAQSGVVLVRWTGALPTPSAGSSPPPYDVALSRGQTAVVDTAILSAATLRVCDSQGGAFGVAWAGDADPIGTSPVPPPLGLAPQRNLGLTVVSSSPTSWTVPVDSSVNSLVIATNKPLSSVTVVGNATGISYYASPAGGLGVAAPVTFPVLSALDSLLMVSVATAFTPAAVWVVASPASSAASVAPVSISSTPVPVTTAAALQTVAFFTAAYAAAAATTLVPYTAPKQVSLYRLLLQHAAGAAGSYVGLYGRPSGTQYFHSATWVAAQPWVSLDLGGVTIPNGDHVTVENVGAAATGIVSAQLLYSQA
jgi:hypothetical protein